jgi:PhzF family phenazine biosynthesis protein
VKYFQVDAFVTEKPFSGNPAGVCLLTSPVEDSWMQNVAFEINQSETAFLLPEKDGYRLRWFTPSMEVKLCGHATLASAHVLWQEGLLKPNEEGRFFTQSGLLTASKENEYIQLDFPVRPTAPCEKPANLEKSLGVSVLSVSHYGSGYLAELSSGDDVKKIKPDFALMETFLNINNGLYGVIITARSSQPEYDIVSRFFAPVAGIPEDPVTGSAHCSLAPYWTPRLNKKTLNAYQASARGGALKITLEDDRVYLSGKAVTKVIGNLV